MADKFFSKNELIQGGISGASALANMLINSTMKTGKNKKPVMVKAKTVDPKINMDPLFEQNQRGLNTAVQGMDGSTGSNAVRADLYAKMLEGNQNAMMQKEGLEKQIESQNAQAENRVNLVNAQSLDRHNQMVTANENAKIGNYANSVTALANTAQGMMGDKISRENDLDRLQMIVNGFDPNDTASRSEYQGTYGQASQPKQQVTPQQDFNPITDNNKEFFAGGGDLDQKKKSKDEGFDLGTAGFRDGMRSGVNNSFGDELMKGEEKKVLPLNDSLTTERMDALYGGIRDRVQSLKDSGKLNDSFLSSNFERILGDPKAGMGVYENDEGVAESKLNFKTYYNPDEHQSAQMFENNKRDANLYMNRTVPKMNDDLKFVQDFVQGLNDDELAQILKTDYAGKSAVEVFKAMPKSLMTFKNAPKAYKAYKIINNLRDEGYSFDKGGKL